MGASFVLVPLTCCHGNKVLRFPAPLAGPDFGNDEAVVILLKLSCLVCWGFSSLPVCFAAWLVTACGLAPAWEPGEVWLSSAPAFVRGAGPFGVLTIAEWPVSICVTGLGFHSSFTGLLTAQYQCV